MVRIWISAEKHLFFISQILIEDSQSKKDNLVTNATLSLNGILVKL
jgi:hypothetical protein